MYRVIIEKIVEKEKRDFLGRKTVEVSTFDVYTQDVEDLDIPAVITLINQRGKNDDK